MNQPLVWEDATPTFEAQATYMNWLHRTIEGPPEFPSRIAELEHECEILGHEEGCVMCRWEAAR